MESPCRHRVCYCKFSFLEMAVFTKFQNFVSMYGLIYAVKWSYGIFL